MPGRLMGHRLDRPCVSTREIWSLSISSTICQSASPFTGMALQFPTVPMGSPASLRMRPNQGNLTPIVFSRKILAHTGITHIKKALRRRGKVSTGCSWLSQPGRRPTMILIPHWPCIPGTAYLPLTCRREHSLSMHDPANGYVYGLSIRITRPIC